jgi:hypothetical protein
MDNRILKIWKWKAWVFDNLTHGNHTLSWPLPSNMSFLCSNFESFCEDDRLPWFLGYIFYYQAERKWIGSTKRYSCCISRFQFSLSFNETRLENYKSDTQPLSPEILGQVHYWCGHNVTCSGSSRDEILLDQHRDVVAVFFLLDVPANSKLES